MTTTKQKNQTLTFIICLTLLLTTASVLTQPAAGEEGHKQAQVNSLHVETTIDNSYAVTTLCAEVENPHDESAQAHIGIMLPEKAFISNLTLTLGETNYYGEVIQKDIAQQRYDDAVASGNTAGMVQARDLKQFNFAVNMEAKQKATISIRYEEFLTKELGEERYLLPLSGLSLDTIKDFRLEIVLDSMLVINSLMVEGDYQDDVDITYEGTRHIRLGYQKANFVPEEDFAFSYTQNAMPVNGSMLVHYDSEAEEYYFFNLFSPQKDDLGGMIPKDIIFVLDRSGSMSGEKITQMKDAFANIVDQLPEQDRFNIITFESKIEHYKDGLLTATEKNREEAKDYIDSIGPAGSTNLYNGVELALNMLKDSGNRAPIIILLTDGHPNAGKFSTPPSIRTNVKEHNTVDCPIFCLGFGDGVDMDFLSALSLENHATARQIYTGQDAREQMTDFYDTISTTLLRDIRFSYSEGTCEVHPAYAPSLFGGSELIVTGRCNGSLDFIGSHITAYTTQGEREFKENYQLSPNDANNPFIKRFWAYSAIYDLMDQILIQGETEELVSQIVNISMEAQFVTPYTALYLDLEEAGEPGEDPDNGEDDEPDTSVNGGSGSNPNYYPPNNGGSGGHPSSSPPPTTDASEDGAAPGFELVALVGCLALAAGFANRKKKRN